MFKLTQIDKHSQTFESDDKKYQIVRAGFTAWVKATPFLGVSCLSEQGREMESYYLDFKMEVHSVIGRVPVTLGNFLKLRKFRTVTVRIDS